MYICILMLVIGEHSIVGVGFSHALRLEWEDRTHVPMWSQMLTASPTQVVNSCAMKRCIIRFHVAEDFWSYRAVFGPNTLFCNWNFRTPAWVNNVIGLHESCLGQLPWDRFTGRVPFTEGFLSSGYQLGFSALLISLEFFPHTCNNSSKVVNDILVGLCFGNYIGKSL